MLLKVTIALRIALAFFVIAIPATACAQVSVKTWRIGYIGTTRPTTADSAYLGEVFVRRLQEHGYVEGRNLVIERRYHEGKIERLPGLVAEVLRLQTDVIVVGEVAGIRAAKQATSTIPIVMNGANDPVGNGLVASMGRPGGNVTGIANLQVDLVPKRLELLKSAIPSTSRVAYVRGNFSGLGASQLTNLASEQDAAARALGIDMFRVALNTPQDLVTATATVVGERPDALLISPSPTNFILRRELAEFAIRQRLPTMASTREEVVAGALMSYGPSNADRFRRLADFIDRIFNGVNPGDIPVEQPTKFELLVNLKTAKALGLSIPPSFLARADEVIR